MPNYAYLSTDLRCPFCDTIATDVVIFQWGLCPARDLREEYVYHLDDPIAWRRCQDTSILSWAYFLEGEYTGGANIGDPAIQNLITRDMRQFTWDDPAERRRCEHCGQPLEGAAIEIREGIIRRAWIYQPGELANEVDIYIARPDGSRIPMPEWNDHSMGTVRAC